MQLDGLIFDLDGVITDTITLHYQAWERLAQEEELPFSIEEYDTLRGLSRRESLHRILKGRVIDCETAERWMERKNSYFRAMMANLTPDDLLPGVADWLHDARQMRLAVGLGSASRNARDVLTRLGLESAFDAVGDGHTVTNIKPAPDVFLWVAGRLNLNPAHALVIEDGAAGIVAGRAGGFWTLGVGHPEVVGAAHLVVPTLAHLSLAMLPQHLTESALV